jgi:hypothetical protein
LAAPAEELLDAGRERPVAVFVTPGTVGVRGLVGTVGVETEGTGALTRPPVLVGTVVVGTVVVGTLGAGGGVGTTGTLTGGGTGTLTGGGGSGILTGGGGGGGGGGRGTVTGGGGSTGTSTTGVGTMEAVTGVAGKAKRHSTRRSTAADSRLVLRTIFTAATPRLRTAIRGSFTQFADIQSRWSAGDRPANAAERLVALGWRARTAPDALALVVVKRILDFSMASLDALDGLLHGLAGALEGRVPFCPGRSARDVVVPTCRIGL